MTRFRTHWLALLGATLLLALSVSSALGAHPENSGNRGQQVASFVHSLVFGTDEDPEQEPVEEEEQDEEQQDEEQQDEEDGDSNHGWCVREVAWSLEVGGLNENHGGAVSEAARVTCRSDGDSEEPVEEDEATAASDEEAASAGPGKSAQAHERAPGKNKAEARGAGGQHPGKGHGRGGH